MGKYAKFIVAAIAAAGVVASSGLLPQEYALWVNVGIAAVSAALVYLVPNADLSAGPKDSPSVVNGGQS